MENVIFLESAEDLLALDDRAIVPFVVTGSGDAWDGLGVYLRPLSGAERSRVEAMMARGRRKDGSVELPDNYHAKIAAQGLVNAKGERLFTNGQAQELGNKNGAAIGQISEEILRISGMNPEAVEEAKNDSEGDQSDGSSSDSL